MEKENIEVRMICQGTDVSLHDIASGIPSHQGGVEENAGEGAGLVIGILQHVKNMGIQKSPIPLTEGVGAAGNGILHTALRDIEKLHGRMPMPGIEIMDKKAPLRILGKEGKAGGSHPVEFFQRGSVDSIIQICISVCIHK